MISVDEKALIKKRNLMTENWDPWIDEGYADASSNMMVPKTEAVAVSCRIIRLEPGGHTGMHSHDRIHHVMALDGLPELETDTERVELGEFIAVKVDANVPHRFVNRTYKEAIIQVLNVFQK